MNNALNVNFYTIKIDCCSSFEIVLDFKHALIVFANNSSLDATEI